MTTVCPWHETVLENTTATAATLLLSDAGNGGGELALALAEKFCGEGSGAADLLITLPENNHISVAAIRHLITFLSFAPVSRQRRVALVLQAECMQAAAANALLKTLEEPHHDKVLLLWASVNGQLPATVVSRCRMLMPAAPTKAVAATYTKTHGNVDLLAYCAHRPLATTHYPPNWQTEIANYLQQGAELDINAALPALTAGVEQQLATWQQQVLEYIEQGAPLNPHCAEWEESKIIGGINGLDGLLKWVSDGVRSTCALAPIFFPAHAAVLQQLTEGKKKKWLDFYRYLIQRRALQTHPLVKDLYMREILYAYQRLCI